MKFFDGGLSPSTPQDVHLGLDPSLTGFGLCALGTDGRYLAWVYGSPYKGVERLDDIRTWLRSSIASLAEGGHRVLGAAMESGVVMSQSALVLGELSATVKLALYDISTVPENVRFPLLVPPTVVKKYVTGRGNASKHEVVLSAYKTWGSEFPDDNAADAYCLARLASGSCHNAAQTDVVRKAFANEKYRDFAVPDYLRGT